MAFVIQQPDLSRLGKVQTMTLRVTFADDGVSAAFPTLPANTTILRNWREVVVLFNDSGTDLLEVGIVGTAAQYADTGDTTMATAGMYMDTVAANTPEMRLAATPIQVLYTGQNSDSTAGIVDVHVEFVIGPTGGL